MSELFRMKNNTKANRRTMADRHMRRSACWKAGESEVICLHGGLRLCRHVLIVVSCKNRVIFHTDSANQGRGMSRSMPS